MEKADKDRFDALMKLAEFKREVREKRRAIEWKGSAGVWVLTAGAITYLKGHSPLLLLLMLGVVVVLHSWLWLRTNYMRSQRDADRMYYFMDHAARIVIPDCVPDPGAKVPEFDTMARRWEFLRWEPIWFELCATALLGFAVIVLASK